MHREELLRMVNEWSLEQVVIYIETLRERVTDTQSLIKELQVIKKRKSRRQPTDTGTRGGM